MGLPVLLIWIKKYNVITKDTTTDKVPIIPETLLPTLFPKNTLNKNPKNGASNKTKIKLVFGVNTEQDLLLREELEGFKTRFPDRFDYLYTVSHPEGQSDGFRKGYVTEELLRDVVKADEDAKVFVCGPPAMEDSLVGSKFQSGILAKLGFEKGQIVKF